MVVFMEFDGVWGELGDVGGFCCHAPVEGGVVVGALDVVLDGAVFVVCEADFSGGGFYLVGVEGCEIGLFEAVVVFLAELEGPAHLVGFEDEGAPN